MLHYTDRKDRIHVLTMDRILAEDVCERIGDDRRMADVELCVPGDDVSEISVADVHEAARDTIASRVLILDVRLLTLPLLQEAYNRVSGFNRGDLNQLCYTLVIGDGPRKLFHPGTSVEVFASHLAKFRKDYGPACFFYDPFLHYTDDERRRFALGEANKLPEETPKRLISGFKDGEPLVSEVRRYFRAASALPAKKDHVKARRQTKLVKIFKRRIAESFPADKQTLAAWLSTDGYSISGEPLSLHVYPLYFEDWVWNLLEKARAGRIKRGADGRI